ncbi:MarR family winged helix-turn-helix transcriptional regulator [Pseudooceanicola sp. 502str34]
MADVMAERQSTELYELVDLVHAVARRLPAPLDLEPGPCTPVEISVMRFVGRNPGVSARAAADACGLPTSNFARVSKSLVAKGLLERRSDPEDARIALLHPTDLAEKNSLRMREHWSAALSDAGLDPDMIAATTQALRRIEAHLSDQPPAGRSHSLPSRKQRRPTDDG